MPANSQTILENTPHPGDSVTTFTGEKYQGDGFYSRSDGFHTASWDLSAFTGKISIQGTLAVDPSETDWVDVDFEEASEDFTIDTTGKISRGGVINFIEYEADTVIESKNFTGNFVWVRVRVFDWTEGTINSVLLNH